MAGGWAFVGTGSSGGTTTPGGSDTNIQFNNNGSFSGSALLTTDGSGSLSASVNISASAFYGDGSNLTNVTASAVEVADATLSRSVSNVEDTAATYSLTEIILAALESTRTSSLLTVRKTDLTTFNTRTLTTSASAPGVTAVTED